MACESNASNSEGSTLLAIVYERTRSMLAVIVLHNVIDGGKLLAWYVWSLLMPG